MRGLSSTKPSCSLTKAFATPFDNAVATARTCYSSKIIFDEDVRASEKSRALRDKIAHSTYVAGHHTTLQHAHFQFALKNVSRHAIWSFFHSHPFYNSEQVSQRYVEVKSGCYLVPDFGNQALTDRYVATIEEQNRGYQRLIQLLHPVCSRLYFSIYHGRKKHQDDPRWQNAIKKRCQEVARYVLPIATHTHLYHTISGLTLHRYHRLAQSLDCPLEQRLLVSGMVDEVNRFDPDFFKNIEDEMPLADTMEARVFNEHGFGAIDSTNAHRWAQDFDLKLQGKTARLVACSNEPERLLGEAVRACLQVSAEQMSDQQAVAMLLSPNKNRYLGESLNLLSLGRLSSALDLVHVSFQKRLSHAADCQSQRHRMLPSVKPIFSRTINLEEPDFITPEIFLHDDAADARALYNELHHKTFETLRWLHEQGATPESLQYVLTNAHPIRFTESGTLMHHLHKWTSRLCYNAQDEIWRSARDEVLAVQAEAPTIGRFLLPPCGLRKMSGHTPLCPEGDRYCGIPVWKSEVKDFQRHF